MHMVKSSARLDGDKRSWALKSMRPFQVILLALGASMKYGEWQVSNVGDDTLKTAFRNVCDVMLEYGLDLEQV